MELHSLKKSRDTEAKTRVGLALGVLFTEFTLVNK